MAKLRIMLPATPRLESSLSLDVVRPPRDPARSVSLIGVVQWRRKERVFFRARLTLNAGDQRESTQHLRFPLPADLPAPRITEVLSVRYWLVSEIEGQESERFAIPFVMKKTAPAIPLQLVARRSPDEPSIEVALRSSCIAERIEGALAVQAPLVEPARVELHQVLEWRPGTLMALREEKMVAISQLPVERLPVGKTCFFVISIPGGSPLSWTHPDFGVRWFLRVMANFGSSKWSFEVDVQLSAKRDDGERSTKRIPLVGTKRHRHGLRSFEGAELRMEGESLVGAFGSSCLSLEYGATLDAVLEFPDVGIDLGNAKEPHAERCRTLLLAGHTNQCVSASRDSLELRFQPEDSSELRGTIESLQELARTLDASIAHLPVFPPLAHALPAWQSMSELLEASLSPAGLVLRAVVQRQALRIAPWGRGLQMQVTCAVDAADPRLGRFVDQIKTRFSEVRSTHEEGLFILFIGDELAGEGSRLGPQEAAHLGRDLAALAADFTRTGAYR